jgi:biopolymer transport protein ExbD
VGGGAVGEGGECKPNFMPLLDMVLQLVMFFMICANFVMDQMDEKVKLPEAQSAKAMDSKVDDYLILNVDDKGAVLKVKDDPYPLRTQAELATFFANQAKTSQKDGEGNVKKLLIIRAHKDTTFDKVFLILQAAKAAKFKAVQLRAIKGG